VEVDSGRQVRPDLTRADLLELKNRLQLSNGRLKPSLSTSDKVPHSERNI
jgi:hypothetical protein